jgi:nitric oxide reductase NorD protein
MNNQPLATTELQARLDETLGAVLASYRSFEDQARALAACTRAQQDFALRWVDAVSRTHGELAFTFLLRAPQAFRLLAPPAIEEWLLRAMDIYDRRGLLPACAVLNHVDEFAAESAAAVRGAALAEVAPMLELFVRGLSGRRLVLEEAAFAYTDTVTIFLPPQLVLLPDRAANRRLYKALAAHLWAQTWYGTFRHEPGSPATHEALAQYDDPARAGFMFHALETLRLDACIARDLPGLARDMRTLRASAGESALSAAWTAARERLSQASATAADSLALLSSLYADELPPLCCYQGALMLERAEQAVQERIAQERGLLRVALARLAETAHRRPPTTDDAPPDGFRVQPLATDALARDLRFELQLDGDPVAPTPDVRALVESIIQDLGKVPEEYLVAAGAGGYRASDIGDPDGGRAAARAGDPAHLYDEWDYKRQHYRHDWCLLREMNLHPSDEPFVARTLRKYAGVLPQLRKTFEALRGEDRLLRRQPDGDDVDFDALVEARADMHHGHELSERLFVRRRKVERDIAVMFMVDMSGSTKGWINDAERESLALLCEALEILGDRYAIYGFSGMTRQRCELYAIKTFDEDYADLVRARIAAISPKDYTRMGVTIRHLITLLNAVDARTRILITLSDGKPDDFDGYRGDYGIEDTRQALIEAKRAGIHPFCITIDTEARDYLPHLFGAVNWTLVDDVRRLPLKVSEIYRRLTL